MGWGDTADQDFGNDFNGTGGGEDYGMNMPGEMGDGSRNKLIPVYFDRNLQPVLEMI